MKNIPDGSIPDVPVGSPYYDSVYSLYRAGIISGSDTKGSFNPLTGITRGEISVILSNIINLNRSSEVPIKNINTLSDLEYYLNQNMSSCVTPLGT